MIGKTLICIDIDEKKNAHLIGDSFRFKTEFISSITGIPLKFLDCKETTKGLHVKLLTTENISDTELVLLQALLGSDWKREVFNWQRVRQGAKMSEWNFLFSKKYRRESDGSHTLLSYERRGAASVAFSVAFYFSSWEHRLKNFLRVRMEVLGR